MNELLAYIYFKLDKRRGKLGDKIQLMQTSRTKFMDDFQKPNSYFVI